MENKIIILEDFFDDPDSVRECGLDILAKTYNNFSNDGRNFYPGCRSKSLEICAPHINNELRTKVEYHTGRKYSRFDAYFHLTTSLHGCGLVHRDGKNKSTVGNNYRYSAGVVYLNKISPKDSGTKIVTEKPGFDNLPEEVKQKFYEIYSDKFYQASVAKNYNFLKEYLEEKKNIVNCQFEDSIVIQSQYNRLITYHADFLHTPGNYFGMNLYNSRLTIAFFTNL